MKKRSLTVLMAVSFCSMQAQPADPAKYAALITQADLKQQLTIVSGAEMEGRETGTEGQRKAADYIRSQFKSFGLTPAPGTDNYLQYYKIGYDSLLQSELSIGQRSLVSGHDYVDEIALNNNGSNTADEIVFTGYGISDTRYDDYAGKDVKGKIVVFFNGEPRQDGMYVISGTKAYSTWTYPGGLAGKAALAKDKGAAGFIVINAAMDSISGNFARFAKKSNMRLIKDQPASINGFTIPGGMAAALLGDDFFRTTVEQAKKFLPMNSLSFSKKIQVRYNYEEQKIDGQSSNVAGVLEGTDKKDEYIILTGHYDHLGTHNGQIYYGADDDGSGTCTVIEMAKAFAQAKADGNGPRRSILFMTVSGEEKGLWGSEYFSEHPLVSLDKTSVDLNTDMIGRIDTERKLADTLNYVYVIGHNKLSSELQGINEAANKASSNITLDYKYDDPADPNRIYYRSDHYNFARKGVPILFFYDGMLLADYHKPTDTIDKINFDVYEKRARMIFYTAWNMANRDQMVKRDIPLN